MKSQNRATDPETILRIVARACELDGYLDGAEVAVYLYRCHTNSAPMDFEKLETAPDFDLLHDVYGILRHTDRATGKLGGCFLPRCAKMEVVK